MCPSVSATGDPAGSVPAAIHRLQVFLICTPPCLIQRPPISSLAPIAPPHIRKTVACRKERTRQTTDARHQLFHHQPAASRLKSRKSFIRTVTPLVSSASKVQERQLDRRASYSLRQNGTGGGRVFAGWIWRGLALSANP